MAKTDGDEARTTAIISKERAAKIANAKEGLEKGSERREERNDDDSKPGDAEDPAAESGTNSDDGRAGTLNEPRAENEGGENRGDPLPDA